MAVSKPLIHTGGIIKEASDLAISDALISSYSNSTTALATALSVAVPTFSERRLYRMDAFFIYDSNTTEDFKFRFLMSGYSGTAPALRFRLGTDAATQTERIDADEIVLAGTASNRVMSAHGCLYVQNTTTGTVTLALQIAQNTAGATAARMFANSYLDLRRVY